MERYTDPMTHPFPWTDIGRHDVLPAASHDEIARFDVIAQLNTLLARRSVVGAQEIDAYRPADAEEVEARSRLHAEYLERMFREFTPVTRGDTPR